MSAAAHKLMLLLGCTWHDSRCGAALTQELLADIRRGQAALAAQHARSQVATRPEDVKTIHAEMKVGSVVIHQEIAGRPD
jgi:hypothetical protein